MGGKLTQSRFWLIFILLMVPLIEQAKIFNRNSHLGSQDSLMATEKPWSCARTFLFVVQFFQPYKGVMIPPASTQSY